MGYLWKKHLAWGTRDGWSISGIPIDHVRLRLPALFALLSA
jgi:hypothetical protein